MSHFVWSDQIEGFLILQFGINVSKMSHKVLNIPCVQIHFDLYIEKYMTFTMKLTVNESVVLDTVYI